MADVLEFDIAPVAYTERDADDFYRAQVDPLGDKGAPSFEVYHPYGFVGRPEDPDVAPDAKVVRGATALYAYEGDQGTAILMNDPRVMEKLPGCGKGESFMYGAAGQFIRCHRDGAISLFTTDDATTNGRSIYLKLSPTKGLEISMPWGRLTLGPNGFHVLHSSGARIDLGAISGLAAPLDTLSSYATLQGAMASVRGSAVSLGTDAGVANATAVTALQTLVTALAAAVASALPTTGITTAQIAAVGAALAAYTPVAQNIGKVA